MNISLFLEIKNEYNEHLVDILTPYIYEGLTSIYNGAVRIGNETNKQKSTLIIFQKLLQGVDTWNQKQIIEETNRIKQASNTSEYFDDLVKAVIKSNIILLTYSNTVSSTIAQSFYNSFNVNTFIHRCYTECAKDAHNNPFLFYYDPDHPMEHKRNQLIVQQNIETGIKRAIRKILPISIILKEYLANSVNIINEPFNKETKNNDEIQKEVMKILKSENVKSEKQKIQDIMNIDKIISSIKQDNKISDKKSEININPLLIEKENYLQDIKSDRNLMNIKSERNLMDINFEQTDEKSNKNSENVPYTSISGIYMQNSSKLTTEIDPNNIDLIEDYGSKKSSKSNRYF
jgi:hypothetical protein